MNRLTEKGKNNYKVVNTLETERGTLITTELLAIQKLGQLEDIEEELKKHIFYGRVFNLGDEVVELKFNEIGRGYDFPLDIRITFDIKGSNCCSVFYNIFDYGKLYSLNKEELIND